MTKRVEPVEVGIAFILPVGAKDTNYPQIDRESSVTNTGTFSGS